MTRQITEQTCPKCDASLSLNATYCGCGWKKKQPNEGRKTYDRTPSVQFDPAPQYCQWGNGNQCKYPARCSHATLGGGPYYCRYHIHPMTETEGAMIAEESKRLSNQQAYYGDASDAAFEKEVQKSLIKFGLERKPDESAHAHAMRCREWILDKVKSVGKHEPNKNWAHKLIQRHYSGEKILHEQLQPACEALKLDLKAIKKREPLEGYRQREPGEDE